MQSAADARTGTFFAGAARAALLAALAGAAAAGPLAAGPRQDGPFSREAGAWTAGVGLSAARPQSALLSDRTGPGPGASLSLERAFNRKHALRAAIEYVRFGDGTYYERGYYPGAQTREHEGRAGVASLALDYVYSFSSRGGGPYVAVGTGYGGASVRPGNLGYGQDMGGSGFRYSAGVGYGFAKNFCVEASATAVSVYDPSREAALEVFGWQQIALRYRFSIPAG